MLVGAEVLIRDDNTGRKRVVNEELDEELNFSPKDATLFCW